MIFLSLKYNKTAGIMENWHLDKVPILGIKLLTCFCGRDRHPRYFGYNRIKERLRHNWK